MRRQVNQTGWGVRNFPTLNAVHIPGKLAIFKFEPQPALSPLSKEAHLVSRYPNFGDAQACFRIWEELPDS